MTKKYDDIISNATASPRPGASRAIHEPTAAAVIAGLELSDTIYKPVSWFHLNPANEVFRALKSEAYLADLEADICANGITDNLVAMPDGLVLAGESRVIVAGRISADYKLPVRLVLSPLTEEEQERRLILSNLLRFEIPENVRLVLARRVGLFSDIPRAEAAETMGKSLRQVKRDAAVLRDAEKLAQDAGRAEPTPEDVAAARERKNGTRKDKKPSTGKDSVRILLSPTLELMDEEGGKCAEYANQIREVLGWQE